jgi:predicted metal-binding membrane protein
MNVLLIAVLALLVLLEKVTSFGRLIARLTGIVLIYTGGLLLLL